jgi:hypothetical protein
MQVLLQAIMSANLQPKDIGQDYCRRSVRAQESLLSRPVGTR